MVSAEDFLASKFTKGQLRLGPGAAIRLFSPLEVSTNFREDFFRDKHLFDSVKDHLF